MLRPAATHASHGRRRTIRPPPRPRFRNAVPPALSAPAKRRKIDWSTLSIVLLVGSAGLAVLLRQGTERFLEILYEDSFLTLEMLPKVLAGCLLGGFATFLLPRELVVRWVGAESGAAGVLLASLLGAIFPGGPYTIYPVAGALLAVGADAGATVAFVTSWTLLGYTRVIVWEIPFFGVDFVSWRMILSIPLPIVAGLLARLARRWWRTTPP